MWWTPTSEGVDPDRVPALTKTGERCDRANHLLESHGITAAECTLSAVTSVQSQLSELQVKVACGHNSMICLRLLFSVIVYCYLSNYASESQDMQRVKWTCIFR